MKIPDRCEKAACKKFFTVDNPRVAIGPTFVSHGGVKEVDERGVCMARLFYICSECNVVHSEHRRNLFEGIKGLIEKGELDVVNPHIVYEALGEEPPKDEKEDEEKEDGSRS